MTQAKLNYWPRSYCWCGSGRVEACNPGILSHKYVGLRAGSARPPKSEHSRLEARYKYRERFGSGVRLRTLQSLMALEIVFYSKKQKREWSFFSIFYTLQQHNKHLTLTTCQELF